MKTRLSTRGQVVIPREVRDTLALVPGDELAVEVVDGAIVLNPVLREEWRTLKGSLGGLGLVEALEEEHRREVEGEVS